MTHPLPWPEARDESERRARLYLERLRQTERPTERRSQAPAERFLRRYGWLIGAAIVTATATVSGLVLAQWVARLTGLR